MTGGFQLRIRLITAAFTGANRMVHFQHKQFILFTIKVSSLPGLCCWSGGIGRRPEGRCRSGRPRDRPTPRQEPERIDFKLNIY